MKDDQKPQAPEGTGSPERTGRRNFLKNAAAVGGAAILAACRT
jgi:hypothetical protein